MQEKEFRNGDLLLCQPRYSMKNYSEWDEETTSDINIAEVNNGQQPKVVSAGGVEG